MLVMPCSPHVPCLQQTFPQANSSTAHSRESCTGIAACRSIHPPVQPDAQLQPWQLLHRVSSVVAWHQHELGPQGIPLMVLDEEAHPLENRVGIAILHYQA